MNKKNRNLVLAAICINTFCFGGLYAWSAFSGELADHMGWEYSKVSFAYSVQLIVLVVMGVIGGSLLQKLGPRKLITAAGIMWGSGWLLTGFASSTTMLYLSFGLLTGTASSFGYNPCIVTAVRWFPDKKGFASGMAVGICGIASLFVAPFAHFLLKSFNVMTAFKIVGAVFLLFAVGTGWYIDDPPEGWLPRAGEQALPANDEGKNWRQMLADPRFYFLWATLLCASVGGLMFIGHAAKIGREVAGMTGSQAAMLVGIMALANFCGRLFFGSLSDRIGRYNVVSITMVIGASAMTVMRFSSNYFTFITATILISACFSGTIATYSALSSDVFGPKYNGINFSIIFTGFGVAGLIGPSVATWLHDLSGGYSGAFVFAAVCSACAAILSFIAQNMRAPSNDRQFFKS